MGILASFAKLRSTIGNEAFVTQLPSEIEQHWPVEAIVDEFWDSLIANHLVHRSKRRTFYSAFDYDWVQERANFLNPFEALFQFELLRILGDISPSHPDYGRLRETAVRLMPTANIGAECRLIDDYAFVLLSTSFIRFIKEIVLALWRLHKIALGIGNNVLRPTCITQSNHVFGQDAELAIRSSWGEAEGVFLSLLEVIYSHLNYEVPTRTGISLTLELNDSGKAASAMAPFVGLYHPVEMFVLCHELAHLLSGNFENKERLLEEELQADHAAMSLYIIHSSLNRKQPLMITHPMSYFVGPALFFQGMRLLALCRRLLVFRESRFQKETEELTGEERELQVRLMMINHSINVYGLQNLLQRIGVTFGGVCAEFYPIIAGCQKALIKSLSGTDEPIEQFFDPRHPNTQGPSQS